MNIYVVSRSRFERSKTLESLGTLSKKAWLVVPFCQRKEYKTLAEEHGCKLLLFKGKGIALKRKFCGQHAARTDSPKFVMLDDDLLFYRRIDSSSTKLRYPDDLADCHAADAFCLLEEKLDTYVHAAISAREGNNRLPSEGVDCSRATRVLGYQTEEFNKLKHGRIQFMEDFDVTLQLLRKGFANHIIAEWAQGQAGTQAPGGCSDYRTSETHAESVRRLIELHPEFVKPRQKKNKTGGEFGTRLEATVYWKKAYQSSQAV